MQRRKRVGAALLIIRILRHCAMEWTVAISNAEAQRFTSQPSALSRQLSETVWKGLVMGMLARPPSRPSCGSDHETMSPDMEIAPARLWSRSPGFSRCAAGNRLKPGLLRRCPIDPGNPHAV